MASRDTESRILLLVEHRTPMAIAKVQTPPARFVVDLLWIYRTSCRAVESCGFAV